jgi:hypothetical protein
MYTASQVPEIIPERLSPVEALFPNLSHALSPYNPRTVLRDTVHYTKPNSYSVVAILHLSKTSVVGQISHEIEISKVKLACFINEKMSMVEAKRSSRLMRVPVLSASGRIRMHYLTLTPTQVIDNSLIDGKQDSLNFLLDWNLAEVFDRTPQHALRDK